MPVEVSVVVEAEATASLQLLIGSLDLQTMAPDRFELVVVDRGIDSDYLDVLRRISTRRSNVRIAGLDEDVASSLAGLVLLAHPNQKLFPQALERLLAFAAEHDLDVVAGRAVQPRQPLAEPFLRDTPVLEGAAVEAAMSSTVLLARRERIRTAGSRFGVDGQGGRVGVVSSYPSTDETGDAALAPATRASVKTSSVRWDGGDLVLSLAGTVTPAELASGSPVALIRQVGSHLTFVVPSDGTVTDNGAAGDPQAQWDTTARLSPVGAAAGEPLTHGLWEVDVVVPGPTGSSNPARVPATSAPGALLDGLNVVVGASPKGGLQIDVGPTRHAIVHRPDPDQASVTESARGSLLTLALPKLHVQTAVGPTGWIWLNRLRLPAAIELEDGNAVMRAFVSGLAGRVPVATEFGRTGAVPTGLSLEISPVGAMRLVVSRPGDAPRAAAKAASTKAAKAKAPASSASDPATTKKSRPAGAAGKPTAVRKRKKRRRQATGPLAKLRRAVPEPLQPYVRRLRRNQTARRIYRKLTGLSS